MVILTGFRNNLSRGETESAMVKKQMKTIMADAISLPLKKHRNISPFFQSKQCTFSISLHQCDKASPRQARTYAEFTASQQLSRSASPRPARPL